MRRLLEGLPGLIALGILSVLAQHGAALAEPALAPLPPGSTVIQEASGDTDGDGLTDLVTLYSARDQGTTPRFGVNISRGSGGSVELFDRTTDGPVPIISDNARLQIQVDDLTGDSQAEILVTALFPFQGRSAPDEGLWIFRWDGTRYALEAALRGTTARTTERSGRGAVGLHQMEPITWPSGAGNSRITVNVDDQYGWREGAFRLTQRSHTFQTEPAMATGPEQAVLLHYTRINRSDIQGAYDIFTPAARASRPFDAFANGFATTRAVTVGDVDTLGYSDNGTVARIGVRLSSLDAGVAQAFSGVWTVRKQGGGWALDAAQIESTPTLAEITDPLPGGLNIQRIVQGPLRDASHADLVVAGRRPGQFDAEAFVLFADGDGFRASPLVSLVGDVAVGDFPGVLQITDVNGDGKAELVYGGGAGAHGSTLAVLHWSGSAFDTVFSGASNTPSLDLADLNGDGQPEIEFPISGYCGSYAASPHFLFILAWRDGAYQPATADYPDANGPDLDERAQEMATDPEPNGAACAQQMASLGHATNGDAAGARRAHALYSTALSNVASDSIDLLPTYMTPIYVNEVNDLIRRADLGVLRSFDRASSAVLHDLLADYYEAESRWQASSAKYAAKDGKAAEAEAARAERAIRINQAVQEYQLALVLDPNDTDAKAGLARLSAP